MTWQYSPGLLPLLATFVLCVSCALMVWPHRRAPGANALMAMLLSAAFWGLFEFIQYGLQGLTAKVTWESLVYIWVGLTPVLWFVFCLQYTHVRGRLRLSEFASLLIIPALSVIIALVDPMDGLMRTNVTLVAHGSIVHVSKTFGPWFWVMAIYVEALMLIGTVLLLRHNSRSGRPFGRQAFALISAALIPWIANVAYLSCGYLYFPVDPTPVAMGLSGALLAFALRKMALFDLSPAGRDAAIEAMTDGWLVIDAADRIVDMNPASMAILIRGGVVSPRITSLTGRRMSILAPALSPMLRAQMGTTVQQQPVALGRGPTARQFRVIQSGLRDRNGVPAGNVLTLHDITSDIAAAREREHLIQALQQALAEVTQLSGLLPICAQCKKIRDDQGYWTQLEEYLRLHSSATFTHGLCPDCLRRMEEQADDHARQLGRPALRDETASGVGEATDITADAIDGLTPADPSAATEPGGETQDNADPSA